MISYAVSFQRYMRLVVWRKIRSSTRWTWQGAVVEKCGPQGLLLDGVRGCCRAVRMTLWQKLPTAERVCLDDSISYSRFSRGTPLDVPEAQHEQKTKNFWPLLTRSDHGRRPLHHFIGPPWFGAILFYSVRRKTIKPALPFRPAGLLPRHDFSTQNRREFIKWLCHATDPNRGVLFESSIVPTFDQGGGLRFRRIP